MCSTVYLETTIISYLAAEPSTNIIVAGNQAVTRAWWARRNRYELVVSALVVQEAEKGDPKVARQRLALIQGIPAIDISTTAEQLARTLIGDGPLPQKAVEDALHVATAAANGVDYLLTWNCRHLANATTRPRVEAILRAAGYEPPIICTPQELIDEDE